MRSLVLLPEALVVAGAIAFLAAGRVAGTRRRQRRYLPAAAAALVLVALAVELWAGATLGSFFGGALVQDRFALFVKAAALLAAGVAIAATDWPAEDSVSIGLSMPLLAAFGVMVVASAGDLVGLWAGLELAGMAAVVLVAVRRPELGLRLLIIGGLASALVLVGFAFLYATIGTAGLFAAGFVVYRAAPTLPLAIPILLLIGGLAIRAGLAPFQFARVPIAIGASPLGTGLVLGLVAAAALTVAIKIAGLLSALPAVFAPYLAIVATVAMVVGGLAAVAVRAPRARITYLAAAQVGWIAAGLATDYRTGLGASLFLLGAFAVAATAAPAVVGGVEGGELGVAGLGILRPARAAALSLAILSLAGAPPLAGFFGEFAVAAALAQSGSFVLLAAGLLSAVLCLAAALGTMRAIYLLSPPEEGRRGPGGGLPTWTRFSTIGAVAFCIVIAGYGLLANPIMGLADQGAEALGLR